MINPFLKIDAYKLGHLTMYPEGTEYVYCNATPRNFKFFGTSIPKGLFDGKAVAYGMTVVISKIFEDFRDNFFSRDVDDVLNEINEVVLPFLGGNSSSHIIGAMRNLHKLGYLPLNFETLKEGTLVPANVPIMTWNNTHKDFAWLPNVLETYISTELWKMPTAATTARVYKNLFMKYAEETCDSTDFVTFQGHDFSSRGMSGIDDASKTGSAHALFFQGSDAVSAVPLIKEYFTVEPETLLLASVPATEHSVMCMGTVEGELDTYRRILQRYPKGIVSIVSDTWDYWDLLENGLKELKPDILAREENDLGLCKTVIRPDSGNPVDIVCGTKDYNLDDYNEGIATAEEVGSIVVLSSIFGYTINSKGYKVLNSKIGLIYGDSITPQRALDILEGLKSKGFASENIVFGIGSYTYQFVTRDTFGFAVKATNVVINGNSTPIFKQPKTDSKKNSAKGFLKVIKENDKLVLVNNVEEWDSGLLKPFTYGDLESFQGIRDYITKQEG